MADAPQRIHEEHRAKIVAEIPGWYRPWAHLAFPTAVGLAVAVAAALNLHAVTWRELVAIPITLFVGFAFEWRVHKDVLHQRRPGLALIYERHELAHHVIYTDQDMAMRSARELWLILMPAYAILLVALMVAPMAALATWLFGTNVAMLVLVTSMWFFLSYEWLHIATTCPRTARSGGASSSRSCGSCTVAITTRG